MTALLRAGASYGLRDHDIDVPQDLDCADCVPGLQLLDFRQDFGFALALTFHAP